MSLQFAAFLASICTYILPPVCVFISFEFVLFYQYVVKQLFLTGVIDLLHLLTLISVILQSLQMSVRSRIQLVTTGVLYSYR